jgi:cytochrome c-type biogenesis protein CcmH/NrfF
VVYFSVVWCSVYHRHSQHREHNNNNNNNNTTITMAKKGKKAPVQTKKKVTLAKRFKCPFCANGELSLSEGAAVGVHGLS